MSRCRLPGRSILAHNFVRMTAVPFAQTARGPRALASVTRTISVVILLVGITVTIQEQLRDPALPAASQ